MGIYNVILCLFLYKTFSEAKLCFYLFKVTGLVNDDTRAALRFTPGSGIEGLSALLFPPTQSKSV